MLRKRAIAVLLVCLVGIVSGCGDDSDSDSGSDPKTTAESAGFETLEPEPAAATTT
jgi:hypothetical protein